MDRHLPTGWCWSTLGDVAEKRKGAIVSGPFGSNIGSRFFVDHGVPVIRGNNLTTDSRKFVDEGFVFVSEEKANELISCTTIPGDLVFTAAGSLGQVGIVPSSANYPRYIISNKQMRARLDQAIVVPEFAYYWYSSPFMVNYIQQRNTGSSVPLINLSILRSLPFPHAPLDEQSAIARILGALDDKIELNRGMSETLEAMARALFKSWFVDFDPVRANVAGSDHVNSAFPSAFQDTALGEIPQGWDIVTVGDVAEVVGGSTPSTKDSSFWLEGKHYWATPKDLSALSTPVLLATERSVSDAGLAQIGSGLLPKGTVLLSSRAPIGYLAISEVPVAINQGFIAMKPRDAISSEYLLLWAYHSMHEIMSRANGSTFLEISKSNFRPIPLVRPTPGAMGMFDGIARPLHARVVACERESLLLAQLRDTILPKLISGELRVKDVEKQLEQGL